ncbi:MAG: aspartate carbamoyltransferase regulatory subunit [Clostridia bacterium]|nr:aspartate carbamoyltransferase regulatory subunit [Clostridia bacterium]
MIIGQIKDGIVLDHITAGRGMEIYKVLGLDKLDCTVAMIKNADSVKKGKKDIIKVGQVIDLDFDVLGYIDPGITVNIIQDGKLAKRSHLSLPERVKGIIRCKNPRCITSVEQELVHEFRLADREKKIYRCIYCEHEAPKTVECPFLRYVS